MRRGERLEYAIANLADEMYGDVIQADEWLCDYADEDDVGELARLAFAALRVDSSGIGSAPRRERLMEAVSRLDRRYADWCEERAREGLLREAREADEAAAGDEYDRRREEGMSS